MLLRRGFVLGRQDGAQGMVDFYFLYRFVRLETHLSSRKKAE